MKTVSLAPRSRPEWFCLVLLVLGVQAVRPLPAMAKETVGAAVNRYTLDISKDRRSDGTWRELYGHIMFTDPMLEKNVGAEGK